MDDAQWVGKLVSAYMRRHNLNCVEMGKLVGASSSTVSDLANGKRSPAFWLLKAVHEVTEIPYDAFFREGKYKQVWQKM